jgi:hypothetical protein
VRRYLLGGAPPSLHTIRPLPDSETRAGMRWQARRQGATATSRVGQEWGRREGLRWLSVGVRMPTGQLGIPEQLRFRQLLLPGSIVVVLGVGGSSPLAHPTGSAVRKARPRLRPGLTASRLPERREPAGGRRCGARRGDACGWPLTGCLLGSGPGSGESSAGRRKALMIASAAAAGTSAGVIRSAQLNQYHH